MDSQRALVFSYAELFSHRTSQDWGDPVYTMSWRYKKNCIILNKILPWTESILINSMACTKWVRASSAHHLPLVLEASRLNTPRRVQQQQRSQLTASIASIQTPASRGIQQQQRLQLTASIASIQTPALRGRQQQQQRSQLIASIASIQTPTFRGIQQQQRSQLTTTV